MRNIAKKTEEKHEIHHFAARPGKPRWYMRIFCRRVPQKGFVQKCEGCAFGSKKVNYAVFFAGITQDQTSQGLRQVIKDSYRKFKFTPVRWSPIQDYDSYVYVPFWKKRGA